MNKFNFVNILQASILLSQGSPTFYSSFRMNKIRKPRTVTEKNRDETFGEGEICMKYKVDG